MALVRQGDYLFDKATTWHVTRIQGGILYLEPVQGKFEENKQLSLEACTDYIREGVLRIDLASRIRKLRLGVK
jgi:hypothetical protein